MKRFERDRVVEIGWQIVPTIPGQSKNQIQLETENGKLQKICCLLASMTVSLDISKAY